nr:DUF1801 domain-containing protein [Chitinophagaceae bacterium]
MEKKSVSIDTVDNYILAQPETHRAALTQLRKLVRDNAPLAEESISYGMPAYKYHGPLVYFGGFNNHCSFFPGSAATIEQFASQLSPYKVSKGTIQFAIEQPIPLALIKKMVLHRVKQNKEKMLLKKKQKIKKN